MGPVHHGLTCLLERRPDWVVALLVSHGLIPDGLEITQIRTEAGVRRDGGHYDEYRADLTLRLRPPDVEIRAIAWQHYHEHGVIGVLIEVQMRVDLRRLDAWEAMPASRRKDLGRHQFLVLIALDDDLGTHLRDEVDNLSPAMRTFVIAPGKVPRIERPDPIGDVEGTLLNAMFHVRTPADLPLLDAAMQALEQIDGDDEMIYREMLFSHLKENESMSSVIHKYEEMEQRWPGYEPTESELNSYLYVRGHRFGRREGRQEGRREGRREGRAEAVLDLLRLRGLEPSAELEATVLSCQDPEQLQTWLGRAMTVVRPEHLLENLDG